MKHSLFLSFFLILNSFLIAEPISKETLFLMLAENAVSKGEFTQTKIVASRNLKLKSFGTYEFFDGGITWITEKPFHSTLTVTENEMVQISPSGEKTVLDFSKNQAAATIAKTIKSIFTNDLTYLEKNFSVAFKDNGNGTWSAIITPKDRTMAKALKEIKIEGTAREKSAKMTKMLIEESSGDWIQYDLN